MQSVEVYGKVGMFAQNEWYIREREKKRNMATLTSQLK